MEFHCNCPVLLDFSLKRDPVELHYANRNLSKSPRPSAAGEVARPGPSGGKEKGTGRKNEQENLADPFSTPARAPSSDNDRAASTL